MNTKRFLLASLVAFIFTAIYEMVVHGSLLKGIYSTTPDLWRADADTEVVFMMGAYLVMSLLLVYLFSQKMHVRNIKGGAVAGLWVGLPLAVAGAASYAWMPISLTLAVCWLVATLIKVVVIGAITGMIYRD